MDWIYKKKFGKYEWQLSEQESNSTFVKYADGFNTAATWVLSHTINPVFRWYGRREYVKIDNYDIWNLDHTLAQIALPALRLLREDQTGTPGVRAEDIPTHLIVKAYNESQAEHYDEKYPPYLYSESAWDWVLGEIIYALDQHTMDFPESRQGRLFLSYERGDMSQSNWMILTKSDGERIQNGFVLFGKYFQNMWT